MMDIKNELRDALEVQKNIRKQQKKYLYETEFEKILKNMLESIKSSNDNNNSITHIYFGTTKHHYGLLFFKKSIFAGSISAQLEKNWKTSDFLEYLWDPENGYTEFFTFIILDQYDTNAGFVLELK